MSIKKFGVINMVEKIEITMMNETVHNFRKGEFGVQNIEINETRGFIEIEYGVKEGGEKRVLIPLQNVEKCEFVVKKVEETEEKSKNKSVSPKNIQKKPRSSTKKNPRTKGSSSQPTR